MRVTDRDDLVAALLRTSAGSRQAQAAVGRLLSAGRSALPQGSPLAAWSQGGDVDPGWRDQVPAAAQSLWEQLALYAATCPSLTRTPDCPYELLEGIRQASHERFE